MEMVIGVVFLVSGYFLNDYLKNIFPDHLRAFAWKRLSKLDLKQETKELLFQAFLSDCENQKSSAKEYMMIIEFVFSVKNIEIPKKAERRSVKKD